MKIIRSLAICLILMISNTLECSNALQERLKTAKNGDYFVTESGKMISVLAVRSVDANSLILEEITAPANVLNPRPTSWCEWVRQMAPGHTSWSMIEIDLKEHQLTECYSFSRSTWVQLSTQESIVSTILDLPMQLISPQEQRKIGPEPSAGETDTRKIWRPPFIQEGQRQTDVSFDVYRSTWPKDSTELAGNTVLLYFDQANQSPFPVWIQVNTPHASASIRTIDFGKNLPVHYRSLPRRVPEFVGTPQKTSTGLRLSIKSPKYYHDFELFAIDVTSSQKEIFPINLTQTAHEGELLDIEIAQNELQSILQPNHRYTWLIVPSGHCEFYSESPKPFLWKAE